jgi:OOP family OmpA-OmpF porin
MRRHAVAARDLMRPRTIARSTVALQQEVRMLRLPAFCRTLICLLLALPASAWAVPSGAFEVGLYGAWHPLSESSELGDGAFVDDVPEGGAGGGVRLGYWLLERLGIEGEAEMLPTKLRSGSGDVSVVSLRALAVFDVFTEGAVRPFVRAGGGADKLLQAVGTARADTDSSWAVGAGVRYEVGEMLGVRLDALALIPPSQAIGGATFEYETQLGVYLRLGGTKDGDNDTVPDIDDKCPNEPEDLDGVQDADGCPEDDDGDGVPDLLDKCRTEPEDKDGFQDDDGCPDPDNDGDGVLDADDKCPAKAGPPASKNGAGCPEDLDSDGDGIVDLSDKCPTEPETKNGFRDDDGCPDELAGKIAKNFTDVIRGIDFARNSSKILDKSVPTLLEAVGALKEYADLRVEISGHADDAGSPDGNKKLSQERADEVKAFLVSQGIAKERVEAIGYGQEKPLLPNTNTTNKAKNRRIEFRFL